MASRLILASASSARLRSLRHAGLDPRVVVTGVDEHAVAGSTREVVAALARRKAEVAAATLDPVAGERALVLGCDSLLDLDGAAVGKPTSPADATERWRAQRGRTGVLLTGQCVIDVASGRRAEGVAHARVTFGAPTDHEVAAYVASGEPMHVAGAFSIDGRGAAFVDAIEGDFGAVIGVSLPLLRAQLDELGVELTGLWR